MAEWLQGFSNTIYCEMLLRLLLAAALGGIVGMERGSGDRPAGFRTHILVCAGSALLMLVSMYGFDGYENDPSMYPVHRDPSRIAAQVVSGIGFLGAGTILHEGITIRGLTTAASLWMISAIGLATGAGMYFISVGATIITFITLTTFHTIEKRYAASNSKIDRKYIRIVMKDRSGLIPQITTFLENNNIKVKTINISNKPRKEQVIVELYLKISRDADVGLIIGGLQQIEGVVSIENIG